MADLRSALIATFGKKEQPKKPETPAYGVFTPDRPSPVHTSFVKNPLPIPTVCPHCGSAVEVIHNSEIYGRSFGEWPYAYACVNDDCDSYVGMHPYTNIPLGTLATYEMREARKRAKAPFNQLWQCRYMSRSAAYAWLAKELGIKNKEECHIGWFDVEQCERAYAASIKKLNELRGQ